MHKSKQTKHTPVLTKERNPKPKPITMLGNGVRKDLHKKQALTILAVTEKE